MDDDLFFVPDHGGQLLQTDHHQVIHAECASQPRLLQLVAQIPEDGYDLATEPPDGRSNGRLERRTVIYESRRAEPSKAD